MKRFTLVSIVNLGFAFLSISQDLPLSDSITVHLNSKISYDTENTVSRAEDPVIGFVTEEEPNDSPSQAQQLVGPFPVGVNGTASVSDVGTKTVMGDDVEDLYKVTIASNYIKLNLYDFTADLDLFLFKIEGITTTIMGYNHGGTTEEEYERDDLDPGTYYVGISIYDDYPIENSSSYKLVVTAETATTEVDTIHILDPNFLNALIEQGVDTNEDHIISHSEADVVETLVVNSEQISDLTGIEAFVNIRSLNCSMNDLSSLDISNNTLLTDIKCQWNQITSLDISNNSYLTSLNCGNNKLTNLDVSNNSDLVKLICYDNQLSSLDLSNINDLQELVINLNLFTSIDISNNPTITKLRCGYNQLTNLDVSGCTGLKELYCEYNQLTNLDLSNNATLHDLWCAGNFLEEIDVSNNVDLAYFYCYANSITQLDVSANTALKGLHCAMNQLTRVDLSTNVNLSSFYCYENYFTILDLSNNNLITDLNIDHNPTLSKVCVWEIPFPPEGVSVSMEGSPNVVFTTECGDLEAPELYITENNLYQPDSIKVISTEDGVIYLVPQNTSKTLEEICEACIDSVVVMADEIASIPLSAVENGVYWLYARDNSNNISDCKEFTILGVSTEHSAADHIHIYPNPVSTQIIIENGLQEMYVIEIAALNGNILFMRKTSDPIIQLDFSCYDKGVYFIFHQVRNSYKN